VFFFFLKWFKKTKSAILTSVSILTTGFDEPTVQTVILNRATTSLTLYHQMIGRGSRRLPQKKNFNIVDLGNNTDRFGEWHKPVDWQQVFDHPEAFYEAMHSKTEFEAHQLPSDLRAKFPNSLQISFDIQQAYQDAIDKNIKPKIVIRDSIRQHALMCADNSESITEGLQLTQELKKEINEISFTAPGDKALGTFIWEPLGSWESFFNKEGKINDMMDVYPPFAKKIQCSLIISIR